MATETQRTVLFLCTGNYYRSRFAEVLFNMTARKMGLGWRATSRGLALERGVGNVGSIAESAREALAKLGAIDPEAIARFPAPATDDDFQYSHRIIGLMKDEHLPLVQERHSAWTQKVEFWQVDDDPQALARIEREVMGLIARILGGGHRVDEPATPARPPAAEPAKKPLVVKVGRETAGRRGKGVTTVFDAPLDDNGLKQLAAILKQRCGTGGTVKDNLIEIQGDQRERIIAELEKLGYKVKRVGG